MTRAYSYIRFSSEKQELGDSLRRQLAGAVEYAGKHGLDLDSRSYRDLGISAFRGKHAAEGRLGAFLEAIDAGAIEPGSVLIVESLDRLSRQEVLTALEQFMGITRRGIKIVTLHDGQEYDQGSINANWTKLIVALAIMSRANEESSIKSKRIKDAWTTKRVSGKAMTAMCPAWLRLKEDRSGFELVADKVAMVQRIFAMAAAGHGSPSIASTLNQDRPVTTMVAAKEWNFAIVAAILKNQAVIGRLVSKKTNTERDDYYPPIIDKELFYQVQEQMRGRYRGGGNKGPTISNLFSGLLFCHCGAKHRYVSSNKPHLYVRCLSAYSKSQNGCTSLSMPYAPLEETILAMCRQSGELDKKPLEPDATLVVRAQLNEKRRLLERTLEALDGAGNSKVLGERIGRLEGEIAALEKQLKEMVPVREIDEELLLEIRLLVLTAQRGKDEYESRLLLQQHMKRLFTRIVVTDEYGQVGDKEVRYVVLHGPFVPDLRKWHNLPGWSDEKAPKAGATATPQTAKVAIPLPAWGINGTRTRTKKT